MSLANPGALERGWSTGPQGTLVSKHNGSLGRVAKGIECPPGHAELASLAPCRVGAARSLSCVLWIMLPIDWSRIRITLVDERCGARIPRPQSNAGMLQAMPAQRAASGLNGMSVSAAGSGLSLTFTPSVIRNEMRRGQRLSGRMVAHWTWWWLGMGERSVIAPRLSGQPGLEQRPGAFGFEPLWAVAGPQDVRHASP